MTEHPDTHDTRGRGRKLTIPFVCRNGSQVSVTIDPALGARSQDEAIADAKEAVKQLAASFAYDDGRAGATFADRAKDMGDDAVFRSWAFGQ